MNKTLRNLAILASGLVVLSFVVVVINQTAGVVQLAREVHPALGTATLWSLLFAYGGMIAAPIVIVLRMPKPLVPPETDTGPEFAGHLKRLGDRLASNPRVRLASNAPVDRSSIEDALRVLDADASTIVKQAASTIFLTTAVSQSGRLDALLVMAAQSRMVWRIAHIYYQRPSLREMTHLYANVAATSFVAGELDDLELHQMIQPVVAGTVGAVGGVIPGFQVLTSILINSLLSGSANAFLTLRVGIIAKEYCRSLVAQPRTKVRRAATAEAARLLSGIVKESGARVRDAVWNEIKQKMPRPWPLRKAQPETV
jgi:uncharacterized membrane protein YcjF (UPF0283 family)